MQTHKSVTKIKWNKMLPFFMSFIVIEFVDIVGVSMGYIKKDFDLPDNLAQSMWA